MEKILVTGATGFVGRAVINDLKKYKDIEVHAITSKNTDCKQEVVCNDNVIWHNCSLLEFEEINRLMSEVCPEYMIHLAWYVNPIDYLHSDENLSWVDATLNLTKCFKKYGGKKALFSGTCFEYEFSDDALLEDITKLEPLSLYAKCKVETYNLIKKYAEMEGISFVWARLCYLFGENEAESRVIPYIINNLLKGNKVTCKNASAVRDYMYIGDAAQALVMALFSDFQGPVNIASGEKINMGQIFKITAKACNAENLVEFRDNPVVPKNIFIDINRLKNEIKFNEYTKLEESVRKTVEWWGKHQ